MALLGSTASLSASGYGFSELQTGFVLTLLINANRANINVRNEAIAIGWNQTIFLTATILISENVQVYSTSAATPAIDTGNLPLFSTVTIINNGYIVGAGGVGSVGAAASAGAGGNAINLGTNVTCYLINQTTGTVGGGGGGGGGGANYVLNATTFFGGSGGGGGAGRIVGAGGAGASGSSLNGNVGNPGTLTVGGLGGLGATVELPSSYSVSTTTTLVPYQNNLSYTVTLNRVTYTNLTINLPFTSTIGGIPSGTTPVVFVPGTSNTVVNVNGSAATSGGNYTTAGNDQLGLTFTGSNITVGMFPLLGTQSAAGCYSAQGGFALEVDGSGFIQLRMGNWPTDPPNCQTCDWNWLRNNFATNTTRSTNNTRPYWTHTWSLRVDDIAVGSSSDTRDPIWPYTLVAYTYRVTRTATNSISIAVFPNSWGTGDSGTSISVSNWWNNVNAISPIVFTW